MHRKPIRPLRGHINNTTIWKGRRFACQARCVCSAVAYWRNNSCLKFTPAPAAASSLLVAQEDSKSNSRSHLKDVQRPKASWLLSESDHFRRSDALVATSACTTSAPTENKTWSYVRREPSHANTEDSRQCSSAFNLSAWEQSGTTAVLGCLSTPGAGIDALQTWRSFLNPVLPHTLRQRDCNIECAACPVANACCLSCREARKAR
jgi:hypothetical protein